MFQVSAVFELIAQLPAAEIASSRRPGKGTQRQSQNADALSHEEIVTMSKPKSRSHGPQALAAQAQYLLNERRIKVWIPFLEKKTAELKARIQEKGSTAGGQG